MISLPTTGALGGFAGLSTSGMLPSPAGIVLVSLDVSEVGDDGGWTVTATGTFPTDQPVAFRIQDGAAIDELCYAGIPGDGEWALSADGVTCAFVVPTLPIGGPYTLHCESEDAVYSADMPDAITIVHRSFVVGSYSIRSACPPPRDVGPYSIEEE